MSLSLEYNSYVIIEERKKTDIGLVFKKRSDPP